MCMSEKQSLKLAKKKKLRRGEELGYDEAERNDDVLLLIFFLEYYDA